MEKQAPYLSEHLLTRTGQEFLAQQTEEHLAFLQAVMPDELLAAKIITTSLATECLWLPFTALAEKKLSPENEALAADLYVNGASLSELAERFAVAPNTVRSALLKQGVEMRPPSYHSKTLTIGERYRVDLPLAEIDRRAKNGEQIPLLALEFGVSPTTLRAQLGNYIDKRSTTKREGDSSLI